MEKKRNHFKVNVICHVEPERVNRTYSVSKKSRAEWLRKEHEKAVEIIAKIKVPAYYIKMWGIQVNISPIEKEIYESQGFKIYER